MVALLVVFGVMPMSTASAAEDPVAAEALTATDEESPDPLESTSGDEAKDATPTAPPAEDEAAPTVEDESTTTVEDEATTTVEGGDPITKEKEPSSELTQDGSELIQVADTALAPLAAEEPAESAAAVHAAGTPVHEIEGAWVNPPASISRGNPVVAEWRVNVNDSNEPPSNDPVDNVTVDFTLGKAFFAELPDLCLTDGVDPPSSISDDGLTLTCNLGTVRMGTAIVVQTPVVANGATGEEVTHDGTIDGQTVELPPIPIVNPFRMDMQFAGVSNGRGIWDDVSNPSFVDVELQWSLRLGKGSDVGPPDATYRLNVSTIDGSPVDVGAHARTDETGCTRFDMWNADGHPWSRNDLPPDHPLENRVTNFVDECILTEVSPGVFDLTLRGINYDLLNAPTHDSFGVELPPDWNYIASGAMWFRVFTDTSGSISLSSNAPTYSAPTGQQSTDLNTNNSSGKAYTLPGGFAATWERAYTGNGGTNWDDTYRQSPGTTVRQHVNNAFATHTATANQTFGNCLTFDYAFERWDPTVPVSVQALDQDEVRWVVLEPPFPGQIQYYIGTNAAVTPGSGGYNPDQFDCGVADGGWTTDPPDPSLVKAVRHLYPYSTYADLGARNLTLHAATRINDNVQVGQDIWMFGSSLGQNGWVGPNAGNAITETPGARYPFTTGRRDILRIITANPFIEKETAKATVTPGVPADFTLTYSATGTGSIPDTVDDYQIIDTLPVGMTYVEGSADPEPAVTTSGAQQVLTWTLDGVATNVEHELTYQALPDSTIEPGTVLTNTAVSRLEGVSSQPVEASVTTTTNGYTTILKTSDMEFISNDAGDGVGTGSWTVTIESFDPIAQAFTDTIDVLPYNGDMRGTSFAGTYSLDDVVVPDGATVYYTDVDPSSVNFDPADPSNGEAGDPTGNTIGWTTTVPENPTAIRVIGPELASGGAFSFQVVITTEGAEPQNVYWNSAQARAEHTELVMRTSAVLVVTDYEVVKTSDPESGSNVNPGDVINYTITVTQVGDVPAGALLTDDLSQVFDDAIYNNDVTTDLGTVSIDGDVLEWEGVIPVGGVVTITYSVTVKDLEALEADGDAVLTNVVTSPGCRLPENCTTTHSAGLYEYSKTSDPETGAEVQVGDVITYSVEIAATVGAIPGAIVTDDLSAVLDDATWNDDIRVPVGEASLDGTTLTWTGDLGVEEVITLTYSVTVTEGGDSELLNVVTSPDTDRSQCVAAPDGNPDCTTEHFLTTVAGSVAQPPGPGKVAKPAGSLAKTGGSPWVLIAFAALLLITGAHLLHAARRGLPISRGQLVTGWAPVGWTAGGRVVGPKALGPRAVGGASFLRRTDGWWTRRRRRSGRWTRGSGPMRS